MSVTLSTFGATQEHLATAEQQITPTEVTTPTAEQPIGTPSAEPVVDTPAAEPVEVDYSQSSFSLGGDDTPSETQSGEPTPQQPQFNLDEELKKVDKNELLKKLGLDDFDIEFSEYRKKGGKPVDYLNARAIDYTQVSDENLIKADFKKQNPNLTPSQVDVFFKRRYMVDELATEEDREFAGIQIAMDANKIRQQSIEEQKKFKLPEAITPQTDEAYEQWKQYRESQSQSVEQIGSFYLNHAATKNLHENKKVAINVGEGVAPFNITIDKPEMITNSFVDGGKTWQKLTTTQTGEPDVQKQQMIALFTFNPQKFIQDLFNYGLQQGKRSLVNEGQNAQRPQTKVLPMNPDQKPTYGTGKYGDKAR